MVIRYAMIRNGVVEQISLWDGDLAVWQPSEEIVCIPAPDEVDRDWTWDGENWAPPVPAAVPEV